MWQGRVSIIICYPVFDMTTTTVDDGADWNKNGEGQTEYTTSHNSNNLAHIITKENVLKIWLRRRLLNNRVVVTIEEWIKKKYEKK